MSNDIEFTNDHDALIALLVEVRQMRKEIQELKDGTAGSVKDHEVRIQKLEATRTKQTILLSIYSAVGATLIGLLIYHILG